MKKTVVYAVLLLALILPGTAFSDPITFTDVTGFTATGTNPAEDLDGSGGSYVNYLESAGDYVSWTHHFAFNPAAEDILAGTLKIYLRDDACDPWYAPFEFAIGTAESGQWAIGEVDTAAYRYNVNVNYLADGTFSVYLMSLCGDFYIDSSELNITYNPVDSTAPSPVPEPTTLILLGTGLIGIAGFRMRRGR